MTLNRLQRIGLVLSVLLLIGAGLYENHVIVTDANELANATWNRCIQAEQINNEVTQDKSKDPWEGCTAPRDEIRNAYLRDRPASIVAFVLIPIPFGWLIGYIVIRVYRWVMKAKS